MTYVRTIGGLVLITLFATLAVAQGPSVEWNTVKWNNYQNAQYHWCLKYPVDWKVNDANLSQVQFEGELGIRVYVSLGQLSSPISLEEYALYAEKRLEEKFREEYPCPPWVTGNRIDIDSEPGVDMMVEWVKSPDSPKIKQRGVIALKDNVVYTIVCSTYSTFYREANQAYFEPMIQSFAFEPQEREPKETSQKKPRSETSSKARLDLLIPTHLLRCFSS
jgi:hypothetical protein